MPYGRYGKSVEAVVASIEACSDKIAAGLDRKSLQTLLPPGAARNALDCALWDLEAKISGHSAATLAGIEAMRPVLTAFTISLADPEVMAERARAAKRPLLKLKLGGEGDAERMAAVREAAPKARLIVDANEAWRPKRLEDLMYASAEAGVELVEQPLPGGNDALLAQIQRLVPVCADESVHDRASLTALVDRYEAVNIKLDKTGGLTEGLATASEARQLGLKVMVGCMVATSLSMAPALLLGAEADWVDLDGPLLLTRDRSPGLTYNGSEVSPPAPELWG